MPVFLCNFTRNSNRKRNKTSQYKYHKKMKKLIILVLVGIAMSCSNRSRVPDYVIPKDQMVNIIVDMHLLDGLLSVRPIQHKMIELDTLNQYDALLQKYGYTRNDFDTSLFYYGKKIDLYDDIYEEVLNKLTFIEAEIKEESLEKTDEE